MRTPEFPTKVVLVPTGERRYPTACEMYYWFNPHSGTTAGPFIVDESEDDPDWGNLRPEHFAIYKVRELAPELVVEEGL